MNILMVASENDGIANCKVGGIGDVIRDVPVALAQNGCQVSIVTPSYGYLHESPGSEQLAVLQYPFSGAEQFAVLYRVRPRLSAGEQATHYVIDHPAFKCEDEVRGEFEIYSNDAPNRPFATDAAKFACFCSAVAEAIRHQYFGPINTLHLHDWHSAFLLVLRQFDASCQHLKNLRAVYTIHNLALQGIRPFDNDVSSLDSWYPHLKQSESMRHTVGDPRWSDCFNPMATGIRLADAVHTVSPSYAQEILVPSRPPEYFGGEGLESDLQDAERQGRLHGILNGCEYPASAAEKPAFFALLQLIREEAARWISKRNTLLPADYAALQTLDRLRRARKKPTFLAVSISRAVDQKMLLMRTAGSNQKSGLETMLESLGKDRLFILLGTGDRNTEIFLTEMALAHSNFLFLNSYSNRVAQALYSCGNLFVMPSSFEPCGIGQMLAMRSRQPCLVHRTGGLRDTVEPGVNGFGFEGERLVEQVDGMVQALVEAVELHSNDPHAWKALCDAASRARFNWDQTAKRYIEQLYRHAG